ncbi:hypothetical protein ABQZ99_013425 [Xanthomonas hortorum pv. vitians]|uniref:Uncharacterized protein n=2 Tax=Xanthomonas hortorum pv. vitians TaxID=83224 RepID=A0AAW8ZN33_9XANT|nr:hypothetical protein [Xanthomonas hortorum]MCC4624161.1 hypothetical protein [Xanthomonas campestris pv. nigromaculans]MCC8493761.1 hypothetical protein [Xanthomonas hortorum pv. gardneri]MCE4280169.1 hypothetical protein [Xanthomonas hortorum pv. vitians]MCE4284852.1 hypothetical protein [Xanthomonas hortorum pv. vitians]MCE4289278.1 hypothetical protein [Xanthomonas hortorum pv. vitians]
MTSAADAASAFAINAAATIDCNIRLRGIRNAREIHCIGLALLCGMVESFTHCQIGRRGASVLRARADVCANGCIAAARRSPAMHSFKVQLRRRIAEKAPSSTRPIFRRSLLSVPRLPGWMVALASMTSAAALSA